VNKLDEFLQLIQNGKWHSLITLSKKLDIPTTQLEELSKNLNQQGIIKYQEKIKWVKINPEWTRLLTQTEEEEEEEIEHKPSIATIIIPAKESLTIQKIHISNITDKDLELWIRACKKHTELAISKIQ